MAFCTQCGSKLNDGAAFCGQCGAKVKENFSYSKNTENNYSDFKNNYSVYEVFDSPESVSSKLLKFTDKLLGNSASNYAIISNFIITDVSIIFNNNEYPFEQISVLTPSGDLSSDLFGKGYYYGSVTTCINGVKYTLNCSKDKKLRLFYTAIKANEHIELKSNRQMLQYICMLNCYLLKVESSIRNLPVTFDKENTYKEFSVCNEKVIIDPNVQISDSSKELINNYTYAQDSLNEFYKKTNAIPNKGYNRIPSVLTKIVELMTDLDENPTRAIEQYNLNLREQQEREEQRKLEELERQQSGYYDNSSSGGFLSSVLSTAAGVAIGNNISNRRNNSKQNSGKAYYTCPISCKYEYRRGGVPYCRLSTKYLNSPEPEKCGHGRRIK